MKSIPLLRNALCVGQHFIEDLRAKERATNLVAGDDLALEAAPDNPHDEYAVAVICPHTKFRVGWVQATYSPIVRLLLDTGTTVRGTVVGSAKHGNFSYNLTVEDPEG